MTIRKVMALSQGQTTFRISAVSAEHQPKLRLCTQTTSPGSRSARGLAT